MWAVDADGIFVGNVPVRYEDGCACFTLGKKSPSIYYLIQGEYMEEILTFSVLWGIVWILFSQKGKKGE